MSSNQTRLDVTIDVFEKANQRAMPLAALTPPELIEAILAEFRELEYLSSSPANYQLLHADSSQPLAAETPLGDQLSNDDHLALVEHELPQPDGTKRPSQPIYLRETTTGGVYPLQWLPAIIGRPDKNQPNDDWVACNLESFLTGLRVSRRHAQITEENGTFYVQGLSNNPTMLKRASGEEETLGDAKRPIHNGDAIYLERSAITLKFLVRP